MSRFINFWQAEEEEALPTTPVLIPLRASGLPDRPRKKPVRYIQQDDHPPEPPLILEDIEHQRAPISLLPLPSAYQTECDSHGVWRVYSQGRPSFTPDIHFTPDQQSDIPCSFIPLGPQPNVDTVASQPTHHPFNNPTVFNLMKWSHGRSSNTKSIQEINSLVRDVIQAPTFDSSHLHGFDAARELKRMDGHLAGRLEPAAPGISSFFNSNRLEGTVYISLPCAGVMQKEDNAPKFPVTFRYP